MLDTKFHCFFAKVTELCVSAGYSPYWEKTLSSGAKTVAIFNYVADDEAEPIILYFKDIGFTRPVHARDLWAHKDLGSLRDSYTVTVPQDAVVMLQIWR